MPLGHGFVSPGNMYQHHTLDDIRELIEETFKRLAPKDMIQRISKFIAHLQREDHFNDEQHQQQIVKLEQGFHNNNSGPPGNIHLSVRPR
eukprot:6405287-Karenia_brevis.AAC.1